MGVARLFLFTGAINGFLAVALGAFGAHGLKDHLSPAMLTTYQTGASYHALHALALCAAGLLALHTSSRAAAAAGWSFLLGILLFSGSLYLLSATGTRGLGFITPFGGMALLAGWLFLAVAAWGLTVRNGR